VLRHASEQTGVHDDAQRLSSYLDDQLFEFRTGVLQV
jgi:hypothetical protein